MWCSSLPERWVVLLHLFQFRCSPAGELTEQPSCIVVMCGLKNLFLASSLCCLFWVFYDSAACFLCSLSQFLKHCDQGRHCSSVNIWFQVQVPFLNHRNLSAGSFHHWCTCDIWVPEGISLSDTNVHHQLKVIRVTPVISVNSWELNFIRGLRMDISSLHCEWGLFLVFLFFQEIYVSTSVHFWFLASRIKVFLKCVILTQTIHQLYVGNIYEYYSTRTFNNSRSKSWHFICFLFDEYRGSWLVQVQQMEAALRDYSNAFNCLRPASRVPWHPIMMLRPLLGRGRGAPPASHGLCAATAADRTPDCTACDRGGGS